MSCPQGERPPLQSSVSPAPGRCPWLSLFGASLGGFPSTVPLQATCHFPPDAELPEVGGGGASAGEPATARGGRMLASTVQSRKASERSFQPLLSSEAKEGRRGVAWDPGYSRPSSSLAPGPWASYSPCDPSFNALPCRADRSHALAHGTVARVTGESAREGRSILRPCPSARLLKTQCKRIVAAVRQHLSNLSGILI